MQKSPLRIIEIFFYIVILILVAFYAFFGKKTNQPFVIKAPNSIEQTKPTAREDPPYQLPPKGEFFRN